MTKIWLGSACDTLQGAFDGFPATSILSDRGKEEVGCFDPLYRENEANEALVDIAAAP